MDAVPISTSAAASAAATQALPAADRPNLRLTAEQKQALHNIARWSSVPAPGQQRTVAKVRIHSAMYLRSTELHLAQLGFDSVPDLSEVLPRLTRLNLSNNRLTAVPLGLPELLIELDVSNNQITDLNEDALSPRIKLIAKGNPLAPPPASSKPPPPSAARSSPLAGSSHHLDEQPPVFFFTEPANPTRGYQSRPTYVAQDDELGTGRSGWEYIFCCYWAECAGRNGPLRDSYTEI